MEDNHLVVVEGVVGSLKVGEEMDHYPMEVVGNHLVVEGVGVDILKEQLILKEVVVVEVWDLDDHHLGLLQHRGQPGQPEIGF